MESVLETCRELAAFTVIDTGFAESDEELAYDTVAPRRNGATLTVLSMADEVICVSGADPVSIHRAIRAIMEFRSVLPEAALRLVVNRTRRGPVPGEPKREIEAAFARFVSLDPWRFLPDDSRSIDEALANGKTLAESAPSSPLRLELREIASALCGAAVPARTHRRR